MSEKKEKAEFEPGTEWVEDMRDRIEKNIEDPNKKTDLLALVDQIEKDLVELDRVVQKLYADLRTLNDNYNASPEEYRKVISEFEADRKEVQDRIVNSRFKMRDLSTPEEWKKLVDYSKGKGFYQQTIRQPDK
jgi:Mg2+ and Co2+ transporter CorA